jgi:glycerol-3-phosphate dehydrogenase
MKSFQRNQLTKNLRSHTEWDVIVIGGGASGIGIAVDSISRGYKTLLLEQLDFAKGTSSRSTKLVHGGVRYLAQGNIDLVREALFERGLLRQNAPHLVKNQSFIIPAYRLWDILLYSVGLKTYDFLAGKLSFGPSGFVSKKETIRRIPTVKQKKLKGGILYHDGQFDDARLAINLVQTAIEKGATVLNYFKVTNLLKDSSGKINGVVAKDAESGESYNFQAKAVINATGVFADTILKMDDAQAEDMIRSSQGVHLILDKSFLDGNDAIMIPKTDDGRVLFLVPWHDKLIVGTTDTLLEEHKLEPIALEEEIEFILSTCNKYLSKKVSRSDVLSIFAGLRPLAAPKSGSEKTKEISRSHKIIVTSSGLINIIGGKWTTYRRMAEDTINKAIALGKLPKVKSPTKRLFIHGSDNSQEADSHLYLYGSDQKGIMDLIKENPIWGEKIHPDLPYLKAEIVWAVKNEMARTLEDVLARRVRILFLDARKAIEVAPEVVKIIAKELNKDEQWQDKQVSEFIKIAQQYHL